MKKIDRNNEDLAIKQIIENANLGERLNVVSLANVITITKDNMTAMETIKTIDGLIDLVESLMETLVESCGYCDECGQCENLDFQGIHIPKSILEIAGIEGNAKLNAFVEEDGGIIRVEEADHYYDIADIPSFLLKLFKKYGICLGELDDMLIENNAL
ncbi:MAG: AbrB/MazE/SpoVT family DNA-binding domain-containing protein [Anaerotignaceae bacterium]